MSYFSRSGIITAAAFALAAIKTVRPAMDAFYATLNDEQKKQLDSSTGRHRFWRWRER